MRFFFLPTPVSLLTCWLCFSRHIAVWSDIGFFCDCRFNSMHFYGDVCQRCFRGHNGPISTLSDKLLDDGSGKIFAIGGKDATIRLWSLSSSGKLGRHNLKGVKSTGKMGSL